MKTKISGLISLLMVITLSVFADNKTDEFKVYGNCGMCKNRIEKAAKSVDGVASADWDKETKTIEVEYNPEKVKLMDIHKAIAKVGHDTEKMEAENKVYEHLPACCQYERKKMMENIQNDDGHQH